MPYALQKVGRKYQVITIETGKAHSKSPMTKKDAEAQLRILNAALEGGQLAGEQTDEQFRKDYDTAMTVLGFVPGLGVASIIGSVVPQLFDAFRPEPDVFVGDPVARRSQEQLRKDTQEALDRQHQNYLIKSNQTRAAESNLTATMRAAQKLRDKSGIDKVYSEAEIQAAVDAADRQQLESQRAASLYSQQQKLRAAQEASKRRFGETAALVKQQAQAATGYATAASGMAAQSAAMKQAILDAKQTQIEQAAKNQEFRTKAVQIAKEDFFASDRLAQQARQSQLEAERRRQEIRARALATAPAPETMPVVRPRRLPPSILTPKI